MRLQAVNDHFVVRDSCEEDITDDESQDNSFNKTLREGKDSSDFCFRINWSNVFCKAFSASESRDTSDKLTTIADILARVTAHLQDCAEKESLAMSTL